MTQRKQPIELVLGVDREVVARGAANEVRVVARIRTASREAGTEHPPLRVVLALDVSGSMAGDPLTQVVRSAERIAALLRPQDALGVVAFSDHAFDVAPLRRVDAAMRRHLARALAALEVQSRTHVEGGLRAAHAMLAAGEDRGRGLVLLLSDGQPNVGASSPGGLAAIAAGFSGTTATLGYGPYHDDRVLGAIADGGRGRYAFVPDPQLCQLELAQALGGQAEAVAVGVQARLCPLAGAHVAWVAGSTVRMDGPCAVIDLPDLGPGAETVVAARMSVTADRHILRAPLATVNVSWRDPGDGTPDAIERRIEVAVADNASPPRPDVVRAALVAEVAHRRTEACGLADRGHWDDASAMLEALESRIRAAPGHDTDADLSEALEQLIDDIEVMRRRPDAATYAAYRRGQRDLDRPAAVVSPSARALLDDAAGDFPSAMVCVLAGPAKGRAFALQRHNDIGRSTQAGIGLPDPSISRRHAVIQAAHGAFWIVDLGSTNTTHVNGTKIDRQQLRDGDEIRVGTGSVLRYLER